jgi:hypothetical protein
MTNYSFPLSGASEFVKRIDAAPADVQVHHWVLRDDNQQHYHGRLRLEDDPVYLELRWKPNSRGREQVVGTFRLHLGRLAADGYVRQEGEGVNADEVRLRFYRGERGVVYIQSRDDLPGLPVGVVDVTLD